MQSSMYVALSGQMALQKRMDTIAHNVANASTTGFRAENVTFRSIASKSARASIDYSAMGKESFSTNTGAFVQTGNPLDIAMRGDAFLAIATPAGVVYTRDGRMRISAAGDLETLTGNPVLDAGGAPLQISPAKGPIDIAANGVISQNGKNVGTIGLFTFSPDNKLHRSAGAGLIPDRPAEPVADYTKDGVVQGVLENANVNPILEMTRLIAVSRAFEQISASIDKADTTLNDAIRTLGSGR